MSAAAGAALLVDLFTVGTCKENVPVIRVILHFTVLEVEFVRRVLVTAKMLCAEAGGVGVQRGCIGVKATSDTDTICLKQQI